MLTDCASAIDNIKIGKFPDICGFVGTQSIVCCTDRNPFPGGITTTPKSKTTKTTKTQKTTTTASTTNSPIGSRIVGETCKRSKFVFFWINIFVASFVRYNFLFLSSIARIVR